MAKNTNSEDKMLLEGVADILRKLGYTVCAPGTNPEAKSEIKVAANNPPVKSEKEKLTREEHFKKYGVYPRGRPPKSGGVTVSKVASVSTLIVELPKELTTKEKRLAALEKARAARKIKGTAVTPTVTTNITCDDSPHSAEDWEKKYLELAAKQQGNPATTVVNNTPATVTARPKAGVVVKGVRVAKRG